MTRILVVDDDPGVRAVVTDALRLDGYEVEAVANGQEALGAMGRQRPAALVLDLAMPSMDGPTFVRTLREQTRWGRVPLVVLSGTPGVGVASARLGARACLRKPFALPELVAAVERVARADQA
jgi:CheY-like chemotaxis protein